MQLPDTKFNLDIIDLGIGWQIKLLVQNVPNHFCKVQTPIGLAQEINAPIKSARVGERNIRIA